MTAKEQLLERVRGLSEAEAAEALRLLDARRDSLSRRLDGRTSGGRGGPA